MSETTDKIGSRRLAIGLAALLVFILLDLGLFGWMIFRSLSEREIRQVLLDTRAEAESLAEQIAEGAVRQGGDLYTVVAVEREVRTYVDSILAQRDLIQNFEIRDREGVLVYSGSREDTIPLGGDEAVQILEGGGELGPRIERRVEERPFTFDTALPSELDVPIGELGFLRVSLSRGELERRVSDLRSDLVRNTSLIALMTLLVLGLAYWIVWRLWRRGRRLEEQAVEAERMAYVGTLASGLAHEIRNPLNSLSLNMQLLEEEMHGAVPNADPSRGRLLNMTRDEIGRLERLVTDFLSYARPPGLDPDEVSARELLERCRDLLQVEATKRGARLAIEDETAGARVRVDPAQLGQLFINLVQNGMAAAHEAGRPPRVTLRASKRGDRTLFEVSDNGAGVPAGEREKIFDLFYSSRKGGTGLGLAIVKRIAQAHDAGLEVDSTPGEGTTVRLVLPVERSVHPAREPVQAPTAARHAPR